MCTVHYEHIVDSFYCCIIGKFRLIVDKRTNCFNAAKLCTMFSYQYIANWKKLRRSKHLISYYASRPNSLYLQHSKNTPISRKIAGTFVCKELLLDIAAWLGIDVYDKCYQIIVDYFGGKARKYRRKNAKKNKIIVEQKQKISMLIATNTRLSNAVKPVTLKMSLPPASPPASASASPPASASTQMDDLIEAMWISKSPPASPASPASSNATIIAPWQPWM